MSGLFSIFAKLFKVIFFIPMLLFKLIFRRSVKNSQPAEKESLDASYFFTSGKKYKNLKYNQLDKVEKEIISKVIDFINEYSDADYAPDEAKHIYLNKRLETIDFILDDELYHIFKDKKDWECLEDEDFWYLFGGNEVEDVYIPPQ